MLARGVTEAEATALGARSWQRVGVGPEIHTRHAHDVRIVPLYGDPVLTDGIASMDYNGPSLAVMRAGIFAVTKPLPKVGLDYSVTGWFDDTNLPFSYRLKCTQAARPASQFAP